MLPPILVVPAHQEKRANALAQYCYDLDKTDIWLMVISEEEDRSFVPLYPKNAFHSRQARALRKGAELMSGTPFIWLECDSIPLKPKWATVLTEEYDRQGKPFLISSDSHPPHDLVGGIGVYPGNTDILVPVDYPKSGWDLWLITEIPDQVARTPLIQHSYGRYGPDGFVKAEHRFPRDSAMLRPEAVIFHRDPHQDLMSLQFA